MDVAITGSTGHVGAGLVRAVLDQGRSARVLVRKDLRGIKGLDVETTDGDVLDLDSLMKLCKGVDTVFHAAAKISIVGSEGGTVEKINIEGTRNVIEACLRNRVKHLIHFSSIHAFSSDPVQEIIDESRELALDKNAFPYDRSKALGQIEVLRAADRGLHTVVINPTAVLGPYDFKPSRMGEVLLDMYHCRYPALIDGGYNWVDSRDVIACALAAEIKGRAGESYLASGNWYHVCDIARIISELFCRKTPSFATPIWMCTLPAYFVLAISRMVNVSPKFTPIAIKTLQSHRHISHDKATRELGYQPRPIEVTIRDTLEWFRSVGMLEAECRN
jgi:dihydroflavonol-4-reductase